MQEALDAIGWNGLLPQEQFAVICAFVGTSGLCMWLMGLVEHRRARRERRKGKGRR